MLLSISGNSDFIDSFGMTILFRSLRIISQFTDYLIALYIALVVRHFASDDDKIDGPELESKSQTTIQKSNAHLTDLEQPMGSICDGNSLSSDMNNFFVPREIDDKRTKTYASFDYDVSVSKSRYLLVENHNKSRDKRRPSNHHGLSS